MPLMGGVRSADPNGMDVGRLALEQVRGLLDQLAHERLTRPLAPEVELFYRQLCAREAELLDWAC